MQMDDQVIARIVQKVVERLKESASEAKGQSALSAPCQGLGDGIFPDVESAVKAALEAHQKLDADTLERRNAIIAAMRKAAEDVTPEISRMAVEESGLGRVEDKVKKNILAARKTPGVEDLTALCETGDRGLVLTERAPYGVIGSVIPCTNPTETIICNAIGMVAGGNAVVFNAHPLTKRTSNFCVQALSRAIAAAGGPPNLLVAVAEPTIETAQQLMKSPAIRLLVVTGGPGVVKAAMNSGKKVIAAGPGNPPAVVDETADLPKAARNIMSGATLDNNIVCICEKEIIAVAAIADALKEELRKCGAFEANHLQCERLRRLVLDEEGSPEKHGAPNKKFVGKDAKVILAEIGVRVGDEVRMVLVEVDENHPFVWTEQLMPVIPLVRVPDVDTAIALAKKVERGNRHTATMHSRNIDKLSMMARAMNNSLFVKNGPSHAGLGFGGEGYTSFTIASPTGEGLTRARHFTRERRCTLVDHFRIV